MNLENRQSEPFALRLFLSEQSHCHQRKSVATKCGHKVHPSSPSHTPYCPACVLELAKSKFEEALGRLLQNGGPQCPRDQRNTGWKRASLSYTLAKRCMRRVQKKDQLRVAREQAWDIAHCEAEVTNANRGHDTGFGSDCTICVSHLVQPDGLPEATAKDIAWWERPEVAAPEESPRTPPPSLSLRPYKNKGWPKGSPVMRKLIEALRVKFVAIVAEQQQLERRYQTEAAVRRKHNMGDDVHFDDDFCDSPISGIVMRQSRQQIKENQRMVERYARGNMLPSQPPPSSLSFCESIDDVGVDENKKEAMRTKEEVDEREKFERKVRSVGTEVGYLYFVGQIDDLEGWKEDYLRSNHTLVLRQMSEAVDCMEVD